MGNQQTTGAAEMKDNDLNSRIQSEWYKLVAWSWSTESIFSEEQKKEKEQEKKLKEQFIKNLQDQARYSYVVNSYDPDIKKLMYPASITIKKLFQEKEDGNQLTLTKIYRKLNEAGEGLKSLCDNKLHFEILTDRYSACVKPISPDNLDEFIQDVKGYIAQSDFHHIQNVTSIAYLPYPPRPAFDNNKPTIEELQKWIEEKSCQEKEPDFEPKEFPAELKNNADHFSNIKTAFIEVSRLIAWSWIEESIYPQNENEKRSQEKELKNFFIKSLNDQVNDRKQNNPETEEMYKKSITIKKLFLGKNSEIDELKDVKLTLNDIYKHLTKGKELISLNNKVFMNKFHIEIIDDRFHGYLEKIKDCDDFRTKVEKCIDPQDKQYVENVEYLNYVAYPPRPHCSHATFKDDDLSNWMKNQTTGKSNDSDYLPPSAYFAIGAT
ncbi:MAG TPA: hypothetical protein DD379_25255 [Cyanobacteria bacterium UBA11162]|nr:hypothetical protein [Cyanobacteria bacterium UBA11162]